MFCVSVTDDLRNLVLTLEKRVASLEGGAKASPAPAAKAAPAPAAGDDDDVDLFGSSDEEEDADAAKVNFISLKSRKDHNNGLTISTKPLK